MVRVLPPARSTTLGRRMRLVTVAGPALGLVLLVAACSGDDPADPAATGLPGTSPTTAETSAPGSTSGPAAEPGTPPLDTEEPSVAISTAPAVDVGTTTTLSNGVKVTVTKIATVEVEATGPGDIAGDGVAVHLTVQNSSSKPFDLNGIAVTASYGKQKPASPGGAGTGDLLTGSLAEGKKARGVYVFTLPKAKAETVQVQVSSDASALIAVYER